MKSLAFNHFHDWMTIFIFHLFVNDFSGKMDIHGGPVYDSENAY